MSIPLAPPSRMGPTTQQVAGSQLKVSLVFGGIGTACWCIQILPQIWKNWRRHTTTGVPGFMLLLWASAMPFFGAYAIIQDFNLAIQTQPQIFCLLCLLCWSQTLHYANKYRPWQAVLIALAVAAGFAAIESALVLGIRIPYKKGIDWPVTVLGAWACAILNFGLLVPYYEAYRAGWRFIGISFRFVTIDFLGALFSLVSLATQERWDKFGGASYIIVMILEIGFVVVQLTWIWRNREQIRAARAEGQTYDEYMKWQEKTTRGIGAATDNTRGQWESWSIGIRPSMGSLPRITGSITSTKASSLSHDPENTNTQPDLEKQNLGLATPRPVTSIEPSTTTKDFV